MITQKINLMQWRAKRKKKVLTVLAIDLAIYLLIGSLILMIWFVSWSQDIRNQQQSNDYLSAQITLLNRDNIKVNQLNQVKNDLVSRSLSD